MIINNNISEEFVNYLNKKRIGTTVHYNDLTSYAYKNIFRKKVNIPISKYICKNIIVYQFIQQKD